MTENVNLLVPCAEDDVLVAQFRRYVSLRDKLCEDSDYVWSVSFRVTGGDEDRRFFPRRDQAEKFAETMKGKAEVVALEKKVRKSGVLKLAKAFGVSQEILEERLDREQGVAYYRARAVGPNGQYAVRTGTADRHERGKSRASFDTIMAIALTRAMCRAIMALLGGETTAEEYEDGVDPLPPEMTHGEALARINEHFAGSKGAAPDSPRNRMLRSLYGAATALYGRDADRKIHATIQARYNVSSVTDLSEEKLKELTDGVMGLARKEGKLN